MPRQFEMGGGVFKILDSIRQELDSCCQYIKVFILDSICPPLSSRYQAVIMYTIVHKAINHYSYYTYDDVNWLSIIVYTVSLDSLRAYDDSMNHDNVNSCLQVYNVDNV